MRIDGNALLRAIRYELEKLGARPVVRFSPRRFPLTRARRNTGPSPGGVGGEPLLRWGCRVPLAGYQAMRGPVPDATQWDQIEQVGDCAYEVFAIWNAWRRRAS